MTDVTQILDQIEQGNPDAADRLLPLVYDELRKLAEFKMSGERAGQTLQATALVHDAYLRLVDIEQRQSWSSRGHFFAAAAEAMRRILVERARKKRRIKHGGELRQQPLTEDPPAEETAADELLAIHDALDALEKHDEQAAALVKLRFFGGLQHKQAAEALGLSRRAADRLWLLARTWLYKTINDCPR